MHNSKSTARIINSELSLPKVDRELENSLLWEGLGLDLAPGRNPMSLLYFKAENEGFKKWDEGSKMKLTYKDVVEVREEEKKAQKEKEEHMHKIILKKERILNRKRSQEKLKLLARLGSNLSTTRVKSNRDKVINKFIPQTQNSKITYFLKRKFGNDSKKALKSSQVSVLFKRHSKRFQTKHKKKK